MTTSNPAEASGIDRALRESDIATATTEPTSAPSTAVLDRALTDFVTEHYDRLIRLALLVCRDPTDARDAVQVGLERAWRQRAKLRDEALVRPWVDRIVVREAIRLGRSRRSLVGRLLRLSTTVRWIEQEPIREGPTSTWAAFRAAFTRLPPDQRAVIALHLYAGYSVAETADLVGARMETVRSRLRLAKDRLRRDLQEREA
jgi:RNA polymerase sigma-70 factor (ECF subfamily)